MEKYINEVVLNNVVDELERAKERIKDLGEFSDSSLSSDEELVSDIEESLELLYEMIGETNEN